MGRRTLNHTNKLYNSWRSAKARCSNPNNKNYEGYKGRWHSGWDRFIDFEIWALSNGYKKGLTLDRIDATLGYGPKNCQWLSRRDNVIKGNKERKLTQVEFENRYYTHKELSELLGVKYTTLVYRINNGIPIEGERV